MMIPPEINAANINIPIPVKIFIDIHEGPSGQVFLTVSDSSLVQMKGRPAERP
jgi:hypothetical protein